MIRVAINGYGRIGRIAHRVVLERFADQIEIVAINAGSSTDLQGWMFLLKYDSVYGMLPHEVSSTPPADTTKPDFLGTLTVDGKPAAVYSQKDVTLLPWKDLTVDVVLECTGKLTKQEQLQAHLTAGAKRVILSAPGKDEISTFVLGVNASTYTSEALISNASCTTNCIAPVAKIMDETFGIEKAMMTTIHGYTSDQKLHDGGHKDYRRARAAGLNIVPTTTGATTTAAKAVPSLTGIFSGLSLRVPVPVGSLSDFTFLLKRATTKEEVNEVLRKASADPAWQDILAVTNDPIVSSDIIGDSHSAIVDLSLTDVVGGNMVKVIAWYDNEYGYANRLVEEVLMVSSSTTTNTAS